ncbi:hypothetical protein SARC_00080 [Sphaeroforma arctica JP610]|uniref:DUF7487 domain-containing protein n=1 Tax=Sphaeroforma arctica JP610 TaxID=667725 RepID=A0A0L0GHK1_9EUKA|nr:hypothetical protein SARC_00080 [Sphaeroforma arctica JP610]KNC87823.1 hypothetical protein SARC_00080 [Sphaeroforma arctica JP610]|eukprot:XP_014161725.1 hypothetical protein SARC_00080 [Sphaeroforma arctica JP610]
MTKVAKAKGKVVKAKGNVTKATKDKVPRVLWNFQTMAAELAGRGLQLLLFVGASLPMTILCNCDRREQFQAYWYYLRDRGTRCKFCNPNSPENTYDRIARDVAAEGYKLLTPFGEFKGASKKLSILCLCEEKTVDITIGHFRTGGARCTACADNKRKATVKRLYGVDHVLKIPEVKAKSVATLRRVYGVDNSMQNKEVRAKSVATVRRVYGVDHVSQNKEVRAKSVATMRRVHGVDYAMQNKEVRAKHVAAVRRVYGVDNVSQIEGVRTKAAATMVERYGYGYSGQVPHLRSLAKRSGYQTRSYDWKNVIGDDDERAIVFDYPNPRTGAMSRYFPDFYVPEHTLIVETKSIWTLDCYYDQNMAKFQTVVDEGFTLMVHVWPSRTAPVFETVIPAYHKDVSTLTYYTA